MPLEVLTHSYLSVSSRFIDAILFGILTLVVADPLNFYTYGRERASEVGMQAIMSTLLPGIIALGIVLLVRMLVITPFVLYRDLEKRNRDLASENDALKGQKFTALFDPIEDIGPTSRTVGENARSSFTQCRIRIRNDSAIAVEDFEVFCESVSVLNIESEDYTVLFGGGYHPRLLRPKHLFPVGIIREVIDEDLKGIVTGKRIEIQTCSQVGRQPIKGKEFLMAILITGRNSMPIKKAYRFGDRKGKLFFEEQKA